MVKPLLNNVCCVCDHLSFWSWHIYKYTHCEYLSSLSQSDNEEFSLPSVANHKFSNLNLPCTHSESTIDPYHTHTHTASYITLHFTLQWYHTNSLRSSNKSLKKNRETNNIHPRNSAPGCVRVCVWCPYQRLVTTNNSFSPILLKFNWTICWLTVLLVWTATKQFRWWNISCVTFTPARLPSVV